MVFAKNGMLIYIPHILEQFIYKLDLDAKQEREISVDEFKQCIAYFRLHPDEWKKIMEDLQSIGLIEDYNKHKRTIVFR